jgi:hypothetical protein
LIGTSRLLLISVLPLVLGSERDLLVVRGPPLRVRQGIVGGQETALDWLAFLEQHLLLLPLWRFLSKGLVLLFGLLLPQALVRANEALLSELRPPFVRDLLGQETSASHQERKKKKRRRRV